MNLLKLSLSLRTKSPRIEMFQQIAKDRGVADSKCGGHPSSSFVLEAAGGLQCSVEAALKAASKGESSPETFKIDHHFPRRDSSAATVVLYAQPGSAGFAQVHKEMKDLASRGEVDYVLRPFLAKRGFQKTRLSGENEKNT